MSLKAEPQLLASATLTLGLVSHDAMTSKIIMLLHHIQSSHLGGSIMSKIVMLLCAESTSHPAATPAVRACALQGSQALLALPGSS